MLPFVALRLLPELTLGLAITHFSCARLALHRAPDNRRFLVAIGDAEFVSFQLADFVAQAACLFEFEIGGGSAHTLFEVFDIGAQIVADEIVGAFGIDFHQHTVAAGGMGHDILDAALDGGRRNAVFDVVLALFFAPAISFGRGASVWAGASVWPVKCDTVWRLE